MAERKGVARRVERESFWRGHVERRSRSGESVRGYCRSHGLSEAGFHFWKRELSRRDAQRRVGPVSLPGNQSGERVAFAEVRAPQPAAAEAAIEISLCGTRRVSVRAGFDADTLARVVSVLERVPCAGGR